MEGEKNAADTTSKLHFDNTTILNSKLFRNGSDELFKDSEDKVVFYKITAEKEEWICADLRTINKMKIITII